MRDRCCFSLYLRTEFPELFVCSILQQCREDALAPRRNALAAANYAAWECLIGKEECRNGGLINLRMFILSLLA